jgi:SAM-dependent methyltransferase
MSEDHRGPTDKEILAASFEHSAEAYERGRPGYPAEAVGHVAAELGIGPGRRVLDLAAGTGKLTRALVGLGAEVVAVEPLPAMRAQLAAALPGVEVFGGSAEAIPVPDGSVDVVTVGQAFHWFDPPRALAEIARVLRPAGGLAMIWNEADESDPAVKRLFTAMRTVGNRPDTIEADWRIPVDESGHFDPMRRGRFRWTDHLTHAELLASVQSRSYVTVLEPERRAEFFTMIDGVIAELPEPMPLPYVTEAYWCRLAAPTPTC